MASSLTRPKRTRPRKSTSGSRTKKATASSRELRPSALLSEFPPDDGLPCPSDGSLQERPFLWGRNRERGLGMNHLLVASRALDGQGRLSSRKRSDHGLQEVVFAITPAR